MLALLALATVMTPSLRAEEPADPFLWLEEVEGEQALAWVRTQGDAARAVLTAEPGFEALRTRLLGILNSRDRIPFVTQHAGLWYNFWRDAEHPRGLWRRTTPASYVQPEPDWEIVLDLDALARTEGENWVWSGAVLLQPGGDRALVRLSRGGADATVVREFDLAAKAFVEGGFMLPEAKSSVSWIDRDTLFVGTDFGPGSMTASGYPRTVRRWARGTPLADAPEVFAAEASDIGVSGFVVRERDGTHVMLRRSRTFYTGDWMLERDGRFVRLDLPDDATLDLVAGQLVVKLRSPWETGGATHPTGALLAIDLETFLGGSRAFTTLFLPGARTSLADTVALRNHLVVLTLDNVRGRAELLTPGPDGWARRPVPTPEFASLGAWAADPLGSDAFFLTVTDFLTPTEFELRDAAVDAPVVLRRLPAFFDKTGLAISQHEAVSADGTRIPYFEVARADRPLDGTSPTLLYGYGGFEVSMTPGYAAFTGAGWLERGGTYVVANIRGGGEFGPAWHQAALRHNRQRAFDDFIAVAEDLVRRGVTTPARLGIEGGSNGGLLVGAVMVQRPDLFGAVVCEVPLLDMRRYHRLLAGASWVAEYGNPDDPADWEHIARYSPYQNLRDGVRYPPALIVTSTRDDRVHPGHARKMTARLLELGQDVLYYENTEGGHGAAANNEQRALLGALTYAFLWRTLASP